MVIGLLASLSLAERTHHVTVIGELVRAQSAFI